MNIPFEKSFASHEKSKYWSNKNEKNPKDIFKMSNKKYYFDCNKCKHSFDTSLAKINIGRWCSYCANKKLCEDINCKMCFDKSFASHEKIIFWSKKNGKNPRDILKSSHTIYWFDCNECKHSFDTQLYTITNGNCWCPYCTGRTICEDINCKMCFDKSFASHEKSKYWSEKNGEEKKPRNIFKSCGEICWFDCPDCKHQFDARLNNINKNKWCPYCSNPPKKLCNDNQCITCFNKSFASHEKSKYWSEKNGKEKTPRDIFKSSGNNYWFDCDICNAPFTISLDHIIRGQWCSNCKNKTEAKLYEKLLSIYPSIKRQFKQEWCKNKTYLPFDFCIPEYKIIIELDGPQHFQQVSNWKTPEEQQKRDKFKEECAINNGYLVIRLLQEDVMNDTYDWVKELCDAIEEIKSSNEITNMYLSKNNEYENF
jgi:very-short-patch-repair endonuclease